MNDHERRSGSFWRIVYLAMLCGGLRQLQMNKDRTGNSVDKAIYVINFLFCYEHVESLDYIKRVKRTAHTKGGKHPDSCVRVRCGWRPGLKGRARVRPQREEPRQLRH